MSFFQYVVVWSAGGGDSGKKEKMDEPGDHLDALDSQRKLFFPPLLTDTNFAIILRRLHAQCDTFIIALGSLTFSSLHSVSISLLWNSSLDCLAQFSGLCGFNGVIIILVSLIPQNQPSPTVRLRVRPRQISFAFTKFNFPFWICCAGFFVFPSCRISYNQLKFVSPLLLLVFVASFVVQMKQQFASF